MSTPVSNNNNPYALWNTIQPFALQPFVAGAAIVPTFGGLQMKTALQEGKPMPRFGVMQALKAGIKAAPKVAGTVGGQLAAASAVDYGLQRANGGKQTLATALASATFVGAATAPLMAGLNGITGDKSYVEAMRAVTWRQVRVITAREIAFLGGTQASTPLATAMQERFGKTRTVEYAATAASAAAGAAAGHVPDTMLSIAQANQTIEVFSKEFAMRCGKSALVRIPTVTLFGCLFKAGKEAVAPTK